MRSPLDSSPHTGTATISFLALGLVASVLAVYWPVREYGFVTLDDPLYVTANAFVQRGLSGENIAWAFTTLFACNWHPLTWLSHMLDCSVFGPDAAGAHHMVNVVLHALNALLVFMLLRRTTASTWGSILVAAFFALHPLRVESVAWIAERKDVLSTFFGLLAIAAYIGYARSPRWWRYLLVALLLALSLMTKPTLVTLPCLLFLLDLWPLRRIEPGTPLRPMVRRTALLALEKAPLLLLSAASSVLTIVAQRSDAMASLEMLPVPQRLQVAITGIARYVDLTLWPRDLCALYPLHSWPLWQWLPSLLLGVAVTLICLWQWRRRPYLVVGWLWFLGALVPVVGIVHVGAQSIADRYTYVPSIGLLVMIVWPWRELACVIAAPLRRTIAFVALLAVVALAMATRAQIPYWRDSETLYRRALDVTGPNWLMRNALGTVYLARDDHLAAAREFEVAVRFNPTSMEIWRNLGRSMAHLGSHTAAINAYRRAVAIQPDSADLLNDLAALLVTHGDARVRNGPEAIGLAHRACQLTEAKNPAMLDTLAAAYAEAGRFDEAVQTAEQALAVANAAGWTDLASAIVEKIPRYRAGQTSRNLDLNATPPQAPTLRQSRDDPTERP